MPWTERTKRRLKLRDLEVLMTVVETGLLLANRRDSWINER
jgi:hypothetical protein